MKRRRLYALVFLAITTPLISYNLIIPMATEMPTSCPAIFADLKVTATGFAYVAGAPWFSPTQFVLKPGTTATIALDYVSTDNNLTQMFKQGFFGQAGSFALPYIFQAGGSDQLKANQLGINLTQTSLTFPSIHELVVTLNVSATTSARQGEYRMYFPSTCVSDSYLTVGSFPNVTPSFGVLAPAALILFDIGMGLLGDLFVFLFFRISNAGSREIQEGHTSKGSASRMGWRGLILHSAISDS
jgi:hypothetical protein